MDVNKSQVSDAVLANFIRAPISDSVISVPGIGPANEAILRDAGVFSEAQLLGVFMMLRCPGRSVNEYENALYEFLSKKGIVAHRADVVHAVSEKASVLFPCEPVREIPLHEKEEAEEKAGSLVATVLQFARRLFF